MFFCSRIYNSQPSSNFWFASEYNTNNGQLYNGNNGTLNNNNRINSNSGRVFLDSLIKQTEENACLIPYGDFVRAYKITRKRKRKKTSQLLFEFNQAENIIEIFISVNSFEYIPRPSIGFLLRKPRPRECIAADFCDRIVQTIFVEKLTPAFENNYLHPNSFACRTGKGSLVAVYNLVNQINYVTSFGKNDAWIFKTDIRSFFPSIDTDLWFPRIAELIRRLYNEPDIELIIYLARIIYQSAPQNHCIMKTPEHVMHDALPDHKRLIGRDNGVGVCIGNRANQFLGNIINSDILYQYDAFGVLCSLYTDDCVGIMRNKTAITKIIIPSIGNYLENEYHLTIHPQKLYIQHSSKGVNFLAYRIKNGVITPSKRIVHSIHWYIVRTLNYYKDNEILIGKDAEKIMQVVNSYFGILKWCCSYKIRKYIHDSLISNKSFRKIFDIGYTKITIKKKFKKSYIIAKENHMRKHKYNYYTPWKNYQ